MMRSEETNSFNVVPWSPDTVYLAELKASSAKEQFATYIQLKKNFGDKPSFYMDCAQFFFQNQQGGIAKRVLSNVLELNPEQPIFSRMVAYNLLEFGYYDQAIEILKDIAKVLPYCYFPISSRKIDYFSTKLAT